MSCGKAAHEPSVRINYKFFNKLYKADFRKGTKVISGGILGAEHVRGLNFLYFLIAYLIRKFKNLSPSLLRFTKQILLLSSGQISSTPGFSFFGRGFLSFCCEVKRKKPPKKWPNYQIKELIKSTRHRYFNMQTYWNTCLFF